MLRDCVRERVKGFGLGRGRVPWLEIQTPIQTLRRACHTYKYIGLAVLHASGLGSYRCCQSRQQRDSDTVGHVCCERLDRLLL